jgi:CheY-like chemotaxis protein
VLTGDERANAHGRVGAEVVETSVRTTRPRALVMDDEDMMLGLAARLLECMGFEVDLARDGEEAVELFRRRRQAGGRHDVVVLDLSVDQGMGAVATVAALGQIDPRVRAIVSSGYCDDPVLIDFRAHGFEAAVPKPYGLAELEAAVRRAMG